MSVEETYQVEGMTCEHCVRAVTSEISELPEVTEVHVDLPTGGVTVRSAGPVSVEAIALAVGEAGFRLVAVG